MTSNIDVAGWRKSEPRTLTTPSRAPFGRRDDSDAATRRVPRRVGRAHDAVRRVEVLADLGAPERVVSERDRVDAHAENLVGEPRRDADPVGGVLAVHDARVDPELRAQCAQALLQRPPSRGADDVGDEQDAQGRAA